MEKDFDMLSRCALFAGFSVEEIKAVYPSLGPRVRALGRGQAALEAGEPARRMGVVLRGSMRIVRDNYDGSRSIIGSAHPGELFGEAFACAGVEALPVSVIASEPSRVMLLEMTRILNSAGGAFQGRLLLNLLHVIAQRGLHIHQKLEILSQPTTREKLLCYLRFQARQAHGGSFRIPFDRQALADYLGVDRSALCTVIGQLRREGVIECRRSCFRLPELPKDAFADTMFAKGDEQS